MKLLRHSGNQIVQVGNQKAVFHILAFYFLISGFVVPAQAATINAASCSAAQVQSAINSAVSGDTVVVPAGTCTWATSSSMTPSVILNKAVTLQGQTTCSGKASSLSCTDGTTISDGTGTAWQEFALEIAASNARVSGLTFSGGDGSTQAMVVTDAGTTGWRLDHCRFVPSHSSNRAISAFGYGLIDHTYFADANDGVDVEGSQPGDATYAGDASWTQAMSFGTANAVYIEDNEFKYTQVLDGAWDAYAGARVVFRYNDMQNTNIGGHGLDSGGLRSVLQVEAYNNTVSNSNSHIYMWLGSRGGSYLVFGNTIAASGGSYDNFLYKQNYRSDPSCMSTGECGSWGTCDGTTAGDGNTAGYQGWPCKDQIGRGTNQASYPDYSWSNSYKGGTPAVSDIFACGYQDCSRAATYHILNNRDFFNEVSGFNGTSGIGSGTLANRPATCTKGVAYWATDQGSWNQSGSGSQGQLYQCSATNTWSLYYTPYTYPHPLQAAGSTARTFYVDFAGGSDSNNGTSKSTPWKHAPGMTGCGGVCHSTALVGGDTVIFKGGVTWTGSFQWDISGGASSMVAYTTDHSWFSGVSWSQPVFDDQSAVPPTGPSGGMVNGQTSFITLNDLKFVNCGAPGVFADDECLVFPNVHDIAITNCTFQTHNWISVYFPYTSAGSYSNITFTGNDVSGTSNAIWIAGTTNSLIHNVNISSNTFHDYHADMVGGTHGNGFHWYASPNDQTANLDGMVFCNNRSYGDFSSNGTYVDSVSGGGMTAFFFFEAPLSGVVCNNDFSFTNPGAGGAPTFNSFINFGYSNGTTSHNINLEIYNNSLVNAGANAMSAAIDFGYLATSGDHVTIKNNIASGMSACLYAQDTSATTSLTASDNNLWNCSSGIHWNTAFKAAAQWQALGFDTHGVFNQNPSWIAAPGNEMLNAGSPAIGAGANLASLNYAALNSDRAGTIRPTSGAWDIGAYQSAGGGPVNNAPTLATPAAASPSPATGVTTSLSVLGADDNGESNLTYTWATTGTPPAAVSFSANGTNAAKATTVTFIKAGSYSFQVTIKDGGNLTVTSSVNVTVNQTLTTITVNPASANVTVNGTRSFGASGKDQFNQAMSVAPTFIWTVTGGGSINSSGLFTAGGSAGGPFTIRAASGGKSGTAQATVTASIPPTITLTSPTDGASFTAPTAITLAANVMMGTNLVGQVQFFHENTFLGTVSNSPYTFTWTNVPAGSYQISAVVTDTQGLSNTSAIAAITVNTDSSGGNPTPPLPALDLDGLDGKTFMLTDTIGFNYAVPGMTYEWTFTPLTSAALMGSRQRHAGTAAAAPAQTTSAPRLTPVSAGIGPGTYRLSITASQGGQSRSGQATVTLVGAGLSGVKIYPNPWRSDKHAAHPAITFDGVTLGTTIKIFTASAHEVAELHTDGPKMAWDLTNDSGDRVASGMYLYVISDGQGDKVRGQLAVIR